MTDLGIYLAAEPEDLDQPADVVFEPPVTAWWHLPYWAGRGSAAPLSS